MELNNSILNLAEAADFMRISTRTLKKKAKSGEIPGRKIGREWRFSRERLEGLLQPPSPPSQ